MEDNSGSEGDSPTAQRSANFTLTVPESSGIPVLIAAPHGGRSYSPELIARMRRSDYSALRLEDRYIDQLATEVARRTSACLLVAHAPRALIDLNRAPEDVDWSMVSGQFPKPVQRSLANRRSRSGLGLVPRRLPGLGEIWKGPISEAELDRRIDEVHRPYHRTLAKELEKLRDKWGAALLIDLHSMPPLKTDVETGRAAEFVIGDRFGASCNAMIASCALSYFSRCERLVAHNRPYSGGYVLDQHGAPQRGIHALQIETCRSIYLDSQLANPTDQLNTVAELLAGLVRVLGEEIARMGRGSSIAEAAE